jgi:hypothetical protein
LGEVYRSFSSSLYNFFHSLIISYLLDTNVLLNALFSNTLNLRSSLYVSDHVSHPYRRTDKIIVLCILSLNFWTTVPRVIMSYFALTRHSKPRNSFLLVAMFLQFWSIKSQWFIIKM